MKTYIIGRDDTCQIRIVDPTNTVSRKHATLSINGFKMTITDHSSNGTYINSIKIMPNIPVPVTRKDIISFANAGELDWSLIPNPWTRVMAVSVSIVIVLAVIMACLLFIPESKPLPEPQPGPVVVNIQDLKEAIDTLKSTVKQLEDQTNTLKERCNKAGEALDRKQGGKKRDAVLKQLAPIQQGIEIVDFVKKKRTIERIEEDIADGRSHNRIKDQVDQLSTELSDFKNSIQKYSEQLTEIEDRIKKLPEIKVIKKEKQEEKKSDDEETETPSPNNIRTF